MIDLTKKYRTRDGREVTLISDKGRGRGIFLGYIGSSNIINSWTARGYRELTEFCRSDTDLVEVKEPKLKKVWVVLFQRPSGELFTTAHYCEESVEAQLNYTSAKHIKTVEIEYEVGE
jgi:hypothetical protein